RGRGHWAGGRTAGVPSGSNIPAARTHRNRCARPSPAPPARPTPSTAPTGGANRPAPPTPAATSRRGVATAVSTPAAASRSEVLTGCRQRLGLDAGDRPVERRPHRQMRQLLHVHVTERAKAHASPSVRKPGRQELQPDTRSGARVVDDAVQIVGGSPMAPRRI